MLGRVVATATVINHSTIPLGSLIGGVLGDAVGYRSAMWITTGVVAPSWLILAMSPMRRARDLPQTHQARQAQQAHQAHRPDEQEQGHARSEAR